MICAESQSTLNSTTVAAPVSPQTQTESARQRTSTATGKHTLMVLNPGHFHAALTLRKNHPRLSEDVYVYAEDGADVDSFLRLVQTFNERAQDPTHWKLHVHRGADYLDRLLAQRPGDVVIVAGKNDNKMSSIQRLHAAGFDVLGDKPWLIHADQIDMVKSATAASPLAMDIMTERHEITSRLQKALLNDEAVFGTLRKDGARPAIEMRSVHHLYKMVNNRPLVRPAWYFDTAVQGEGITDVTTHLVDLAQWMTATGRPVEYERDVELISARQWPTVVPREVFEQITGLADFPAAVQPHVKDGELHYLCNGAISYRLRGAPVQLESVWALAIPPGGGDTHYCIARGTRADLLVDQGPDTQFLTRLSIHPVDKSVAYTQALEHAAAILQLAFPGIGLVPDGEIFRISIPKDLRTTHEEHFAAVLEEFLTYIDDGDAPENLGSDLVAKYTLLGRASELSRGC